MTVVSRIMPDMFLSAWIVLISPSWCGEIWDIVHWKRLGQYLIPLDFVRIVLILCYFCRVFVAHFMASSRSPDMDQAGPSYAPSGPLPGTFLGLALDIRSEKLYDLAPDIPDVMGLRALRPSAAIVKVMSIPDSRCIRVDYIFDDPKGMDLMTHRHRRAPDGSDVQQNWQTDVTPVCRTVPCDMRDEWDVFNDASFMEAVAVDGQNMYKLYQRVVSSDEEHCCDSDVADLECLTYQGRDCIMDFSAGGTLSPSVSDLSGPRGPYVADGPVGHPGTSSSSTFEPAILVDPGGTSPSSDLAGMLLPAIPGSPVGFGGTLS